jgi:hypothetical protein
MEQTQRWGLSLRVDVEYTQNMRDYMVECETRPNMRRLKAKGVNRKKIESRNMYILIVPIGEYCKKDWSQLKGYFDKVYGYDEDIDSMAAVMDLRKLGFLQDIFLDHWMPIRRTVIKDAYRWLRLNKNLVLNGLRRVVQCTLCELGVSSPWEFCPRYDCPRSYYPALEDQEVYRFRRGDF